MKGTKTKTQLPVVVQAMHSASPSKELKRRLPAPDAVFVNSKGERVSVTVSFDSDTLKQLLNSMKFE
jgi:hypothetical protein